MIADEYCKVSIHNHLGGNGADRKIDDKYNKSCKFDMNLAIELIDEAKECGFDLIALTQANRLPASDYSLIKQYGIKKDLCILPGVEINLKHESEEKLLHTVVVFDDRSDIEAIEKTIDSYIVNNKSNCLNMNQFLELVIEYRCIIAAHGIKQSSRSAANNPETFSELINISDSIPVVIEDNHKYHKTTLMNELKEKLSAQELEWIDKSANLSSADRKSFKDIKSPTYIWGNPNFDDLYYSCFMSGTRVKRETDIITKVNYISKIEIGEIGDTQLKQCSIFCSHGLNSIIGASGSGKTLLLDIIKRKLTGTGVDNKTISKNCNYEEVYDLSQIHLYDRDNKELNQSSGYKIVEGEILYNKVISAYQSDKATLLEEMDLKVDLAKVNQLIKTFNDDLNTYIKNREIVIRNRKEINRLIQNIDSANKFLAANDIMSEDVINYEKNSEISNRKADIEKQIEIIKSDILDLNESMDNLESLGKRYNLGEVFFSDLKSIKTKMLGVVRKQAIILNAKVLELKKICKIQSLIYELTLSHNEQIGSQFKAIAEKRQEILENYNSVLLMLLNNISILNTEKIPVLSENEIKSAVQFNNKNIARLAFKSVKLVISKEELKDFFPNNIGNKPKLKTSNFLNEKLNLEDENSVRNFAEVFANNLYQDRVDFVINNSNFIDYAIELKNIDGKYENIDSITAGNLSKIYINKMFEEKINQAGSNTIILYDQPDTNMEKAFILDELVNKISDLRNKNQVFITTHEPLLVVNADSNNIIVATNNKTASKTNDISYANKSFVGVNSKKEMIKDVARLIDGKPEAVKLRSTIYGGVLNENYNR